MKKVMNCTNCIVVKYLNKTKVKPHNLLLKTVGCIYIKLGDSLIKFQIFEKLVKTSFDNKSNL